MNWFGICAGVSLIIFGVYTLCFRNIDNIGTVLVENTNDSTPTRQISIARLSIRIPSSASNNLEDDDSRSSVSYRLTVNHTRNASLGGLTMPIASPLMLPTLLTGEFEPFDDVSDIVPSNINDDTRQPPPAMQPSRGDVPDIVITSSITSSPVQFASVPTEERTSGFTEFTLYE